MNGTCSPCLRLQCLECECRIPIMNSVLLPTLDIVSVDGEEIYVMKLDVITITTIPLPSGK